MQKLVWTLIVLSAFAACKKDSDENANLLLALLLLPAGSTGIGFNGTVSINANISNSDAISTYTGEYQSIYTTGARGAQTAAPWKSLNSSGTTYDLTMITNPYFGTAALKGYGYTSIVLNVPIVTISTRSMPADISAVAFNDASVKTRYRALIDQLVPHMNDSVTIVSLGNEVDTYLAANPAQWAAYKELIEDARTYWKTVKPNVLVGVTTTFDGFSSTQKTNVESLNANMDVIILTYYPVASTFVPRDTSTVSTDMSTMASIAGTKKVILQEWGYPSSTVLGGSEAKQKEFITQTFTAWRVRGSTQFPFISFFKRRDWNSAHCNTITGQTSGQNFYEFMCSLGLLNNDGSQKSAYQELLNQKAKY